MKILAKKITKYYINKKKINRNDYEIYEYCFEMLLSSIINIIILIVGAVISKKYYETFIFSIAFIIIRRCIGGYHSKTHLGCILTLITMMILINLFLYIDYKIINFVMFVSSLICLIFISIFAPVSHPNNPIDIVIKKKMNALAILVAAVYCIICIITNLYISELYISVLVGLPLVFSILSMIIGYILYNNNEGENL